MILVVGATGTLGRIVVQQLLTSGQRVRALSRNWSSRSLQNPMLEEVDGDLIDRASLVHACSGVDAVLASAHALMGTGRYDSHAVDELGHGMLIDAAQQCGVKRFVYLSARGARLDHSVDFFRTKALIEARLRASGLSFAILRPSAFMEAHVHNLLGRALLERGSAKIYGNGRNAINFVSARDVAVFAVMALRGEILSNEVLEIGGPGNISKREIAETYMRLSGLAGKVQCVPTSVMRVASPIVRPFNPVMGRLLAINIWNDTTDQTFDARKLYSSFPDISLTSVENFIREQVAKRSSSVPAS